MAHEEIQPKVSDLDETEKELEDLVDKKDKTLLNIKEKVDEVKDLNKIKEEKLVDMKEKLTDLLENTEKYHEVTKEFTDWFDSASETPGLVKPIGEDIEVIKKQLAEVEVIFYQLSLKVPSWASFF